jgi:hypothetical protein
MATIDFLILANHAEVQNGLLYMNGGGWSEHHRPVLSGQPGLPISSFGLGVGVLVPWTETNQPHQLTVAIENADGVVLTQMMASLTTGRAPQLAPGSEQRAVMALTFNLQFPVAGEYRIVARLGSEVKTVSFRVLDHPIAQAA